MVPSNSFDLCTASHLSWIWISSGVVLRPGFIYGKRRVDGFEIPLDLIGQPAERILSAIENFTKPLSSLPASDLLLAPPVNVDDLALAVVNAVTDDDFFGVFTIEQIKEAAAKVKVWIDFQSKKEKIIENQHIY